MKHPRSFVVLQLERYGRGVHRAQQSGKATRVNATIATNDSLLTALAEREALLGSRRGCLCIEANDVPRSPEGRHEVYPPPERPD